MNIPFTKRSKQFELHRKITNCLCWFETDEAKLVLPYAEVSGNIGSEAVLRIEELIILLVQLFETSTQDSFVFDLRKYRDSLHIYTCIFTAVENIELAQEVNRGSLQRRIVTLTKYGNNEAELEIIRRTDPRCKNKTLSPLSMSGMIERLEDYLVPKF